MENYSFFLCFLVNVVRYIVNMRDWTVQPGNSKNHVYLFY